MLGQVRAMLVVAAHPDDEALGCGGLMRKAARAGWTVTACFLSGRATARQHHPGDDSLIDATLQAQGVLGAADPITGDFPNISFNTVPHLELVQFIEDAIVATQADTVITHHPADLNDDHRHTSAACAAALRLHQRGGRAPLPHALHYMEVLSSTEWALAPAGERFVPTTYVHIGEEGVQAKLAALRHYDGVMRPYPHPRSDEAIRALATIRGAEAGVAMAEAFSTPYALWEL